MIIILITLKTYLDSRFIYYCTKRTKVAKKLPPKVHDIEYSAHMTKANRMKAHNILKEFKGVTMELMKDIASNYHLKIDIYEFTRTDSSSYYDLSE